MKSCPNCTKPNHIRAYRCRYCNFQFPVSEALRKSNEDKKQSLQKQMKVWNAAVILYILGGVVSVFGLLLAAFAATNENISFIAYFPLAFGLLFIGLGIWSKWKPYYSMLTAFISYLVFFLFILFIVNGVPIILSLIMIGVGVYLFIGLKNASRTKRNLQSDDILDANI